MQRFDEFQAHPFPGKPGNVDELDKRDRQSLFPMRAQRLASRKDLAVHVSLSSDLIVKQRTSDAFKQRNVLSPIFQLGGFGPEKLERNASQIPLESGVASGVVIGPARGSCQQRFKNSSFFFRGAAKLC